MPIATLEGRLREVCRIRLGKKEPPKKEGGKSYPKALHTFRITSRSQALVAEAAELWGGDVAEWHDEMIVEPQWQVITEASVLPCLIPPSVNTFSQWYELWTAGGCQRRCNGHVNVIADEACDCPDDPERQAALAAEGKACKPTTRLSVMLPQLREFGVARLESHGYYAAVELAGAAALYQAATAGGQWMPAELRLERRSLRNPGQPAKHFVVPALAIPTRLDEALEALGLVSAGGTLAGAGRATISPPRAAGELGTGAGAPDENDDDVIDVDCDDEPFQPGVTVDADVNHQAVLDRVVPEERDEWMQLATTRAHEAGLDPAGQLNAVKLITKGRTGQPAQMTDLEWFVYWQVVDRIRDNTLSVVADDTVTTTQAATGTLRWGWRDDEGRPVRLSWDHHARITASLVTTAHYRDPNDWKEALRGSGVAQAGLLRQARAIASDLGKKEPRDLNDLVDVDVCSRLAKWVDERKAQRTSGPVA